MKKISVPVLFSLMLLFSSCDAIKGIFNAGIYTGIVMVVIVVALIIWIISKFR